ncbi:MAG TPA: SDR family NAD(P)-dependent oxidoreductase, partial [Pseudonocardiaceae bacterium]|nr:SDR family NAD(P)-dependent oxidoreductase [Pseudonocardiaceae bacterium]
EGAMLAVAADERRLRAVLGPRYTEELDIAIRTGSQLVLAGPVEAVEGAGQKLLEAEVGCRRLETTHAYHSRMLAGIAGELTAWVSDNVTLNAPTIPYVCNVTGELATEEVVTDPGYWARHMCETVQFGDALAHVLRTGALALVEIGPGQSLGALTRAHPGCDRAQWPLIVGPLPGATDDKNTHAAVAEAIGKLWLTGVPVDWNALHTTPDNDWAPGRVPLPTYRFQRQDCWLEVDMSQMGNGGVGMLDDGDPTAIFNSLPKLPDTQWVYLPVWNQTTQRPPCEDAKHWLIYTDAGVADTVTERLTAHLEAAGSQVVLVRPGEKFEAGPDAITVRPGSPEDATAALLHLTKLETLPERVVHLWTAGERRPAELAADPTADCLQRGFHSLVAFARAAGDMGLPPWTVDIVTTGTTRVLPGDTVYAERNTLLGPTRLIPVEYPGVQTRMIDVDVATITESPRALIAELRAEVTDRVLGLRQGRRWTPAYDLLDAATIESAPPAAAFRKGGTYLVTGGLGGIGLAMAERIAADYDANLVLMGRTPVPPRDQWAQILGSDATVEEVRRRIEGLQRLSASGVQVAAVAGDVSKIADVRRAVDTAIERFGELSGVVHAAGVPALGLMQFKTAADVERTLAPKVAGTLALGEAVREAAAKGHSVDFIALFSSVTSVTGGGAGQVDYCAANAFLDGFAQSDDGPGCAIVSINWCEWTYNGWTAGLEGYDEGSRQFFEWYRSNFGINFDEGWQTLQRALASGERYVVVSTQDFMPLVEMSRNSSIEEHQSMVKKVRDSMGRHPRPELSTAYVEPQTETEEKIVEVWGEALGLEQIGVHDNFFELGGNSLVGMEIIAKVRKALGLTYLPPHILYQAPTVASLAEAAMAGQEQDDDQEEQNPQAAGAREQNRSRIEQRRNMLRGRTAQ